MKVSWLCGPLAAASVAAGGAVERRMPTGYDAFTHDEVLEGYGLGPAVSF